MIPCAGKTKEQIKAETIKACREAGILKEDTFVPRPMLSIPEPVIFKVWKKLTEAGELDGLSDDEVLEKVVAVAERLFSEAEIKID